MNEHIGTEGKDYRTDSSYIYYYSDKFSPNFIRTALLLEGIDLPECPDNEPYRYLELGFGQGLSFLIHAAVNKGEFWGVDFLPEQANRVKDIADEAGLNCTVLADSFAEVDKKSQEGQLPSFNAIVLHGVWSWINTENKQHILNIINRTLKPGGVVYISYNAMPGWAYFTPVREMMLNLMKRYSPGGNERANVKEILNYLIQLAETNESVFFALNPQALTYLKGLQSESADYVLHEFFNSSWDNVYFHQVSSDMAAIGCSFAASAYLQYQSSGVTGPKSTALLNQIINHDIRESLRDFLIGAKFRADYFIRDPITKVAPDQFPLKLAQQVAIKLPRPHKDVKLEVLFGYNKVPIEDAIFRPILERLDQDNRSIKTVAEIFDKVDSPDAIPYICELLRVLIGSNAVRVANPSFCPETVESCRALNRAFIRRVATDPSLSGITILASPALGSGVRLAHSTLLGLYSDPNYPAPEREEYQIPV